MNCTFLTMEELQHLNKKGAEETPQRLRALVALAEDVGWVSSTHMVVHYHL